MDSFSENIKQKCNVFYLLFSLDNPHSLLRTPICVTATKLSVTIVATVIIWLFLSFLGAGISEITFKINNNCSECNGRGIVNQCKNAPISFSCMALGLCPVVGIGLLIFIIYKLKQHILPEIKRTISDAFASAENMTKYGTFENIAAPTEAVAV